MWEQLEDRDFDLQMTKLAFHTHTHTYAVEDGPTLTDCTKT